MAAGFCVGTATRWRDGHQAVDLRAATTPTLARAKQYLSKLADARLDEAKLTSAGLFAADLTNAWFAGANLTRADLYQPPTVRAALDSRRYMITALRPR